MAFSYNGRDLPSLPNYQAALNFWTNAKTWWGQDQDERKLDNNNQHITIRKDRDDNIRCRLHNTDVVTYHPDNRITLVPWASVSTDDFANSLLRGTSISTSFNQGAVLVDNGRDDRRYYKADDAMVFAPVESGRYALQSEPVPFVRYLINKQRAKALLDSTNYKIFSQWLNIIFSQQLLPDTAYGDGYRDVEGALADKYEWPTLIASYESAAANLTLLRKRLYRDNKHIYDKDVQPYYTDWKEVDNWKKTRYR